MLLGVLDMTPLQQPLVVETLELKTDPSLRRLLVKARVRFLSHTVHIHQMKHGALYLDLFKLITYAFSYLFLGPTLQNGAQKVAALSTLSKIRSLGC